MAYPRQARTHGHIQYERGMTMENMITKEMLDWTISGIVVDEWRSISADADGKQGKEHKTLHVYMDYTGLKLGDMATKAFAQDYITFSNGGGGRKNFTNLTDKGIIRVSAKAPGRTPAIDPEEATVAKLAGMTEAEQLEYFKGLMARAKPVVAETDTLSEAIDKASTEDLEDAITLAEAATEYKLRKGASAK